MIKNSLFQPSDLTDPLIDNFRLYVSMNMSMKMFCGGRFS